jgi:AcrR family transcriptional regulator
MPLELSWVRTPRQARSKDTLERLLDAAHELLEEGSFADASVQKITARAKSSVGAFYARFSDKDALLQHVHQRYADEAIDTADKALLPERFTGVPIGEITRVAVDFIAKQYREKPGLHREIARQNSADARFRERSQRIAVRVTRAIARILDERRHEVNVKDVLRAADMVHRIVFSVLDQDLQFVDRPPGLLPRPHEELVEEITRAVRGYLAFREERE